MAQLNLTATFDFGNPTSLNPSITPMDYEGGKRDVIDKCFVDKNISISFGAQGQGGGGAQIITVGSSAPYSYSLRMTQGTLIIFSASTGCTLNSITLSDDSAKGDLSLASNQPGTLSGYTWSCDSAVSSVTFYTDGSSKWKKVTVNYTAKQNVLTPNVDITSPMESFSSMKLTFADKMKAISTSGITIEGTGITGKKSLNSTVSDKVVTLSLPNNEVISTDGNFVVTVPEGSFEDQSGYRNATLKYQFSVRVPRNTLGVKSITPTSGSQLQSLPDKILVKFSKAIKIVEGATVDLTVNGEYEATLNTAVSKDDAYTMEIETVAVDNYGLFKILIPEGIVHTTAYGTSSEATNDRWNPEFTITYTRVEPEDPLKDLKAEMRALKEEAGAQYELINTVGYPKSDNATNPLSAVKDLEIPTTEEALNEAINKLKAALRAFYNSTDIVFPVAQKWYTIASVNKDQKQAPLSYSDGSVVLGGTPVAFKVHSITSDGIVVLKLKGGINGNGETVYKYLHVLMSTDDYSGTSSTNVTDEKTFVNDLKLAKMTVSGDDQRAVAGLFSIIGSLGNDKATGEKIPDTYAQVTFGNSTQQITTNVNDNTLYFEKNKTNAFRFVETTEPSDVVSNPIMPSAELSVTSVQTTTTSITLTFTNLTKVDLADGGKAYFSTDYLGDNRVTMPTTNTILSKSITGDNCFDVHINGLTSGIYYLQLPKGTFDYSRNDKPVTDIDLFFEFSLTEPESTFQTAYTTYIAVQVVERYGVMDIIRDIDLNNLVIAAEVPAFYSDLVPDMSKRINIVNVYSWEVVGYGHFEPFNNFAVWYPNYATGYKAIKLVMDMPVKPGDLDGKPDTYGYIIPEAAFGDAKFKDYLAGKNGVKKDDCIVNPYKVGPNFIVDNDRVVTGIQNNTPNTSLKEAVPVYNLQGQRVNGMPRRGIYIQNGKKKVVR